jgi:hypothetical protein
MPNLMFVYCQQKCREPVPYWPCDWLVEASFRANSLLTAHNILRPSKF